MTKNTQTFPLGIVAALLIISSTNAQPVFNWATSNGAKDYDDNWGITADVAGNVYRTGHFSDTVDFDPGFAVQNLIANYRTNIFVSKTDVNGNLVWVKQFEAVDSNLYFSMGNVGTAIAVDASGNVYCTGTFVSRMDFDPGSATYILESIGGPDAYVCKLDASGNFQWAQRYGGPSFSYDDGGASIAVDASGNVYSTGAFSDSVSFGAFQLGSSSSGLNVYVMKQSPNGTVLWADDIGNSWGYSFGSAVAVDPQGKIISMASLNDNSVITKFNSTGSVIWQNSMPFLGRSVGDKENMTVDNLGNIFTTSYIAGFDGTIDFDPGPNTYTVSSPYRSIYIAKYDSSGKFAWVKTFGSSAGGGEGFAIAADAYNNIYATGFFYGTVDFDPGSETANLTSAGNDDAFILELSGSGNFNCVGRIGGPKGEIGHGIVIDTTRNKIYNCGHFNDPVGVSKNDSADFNPSEPAAYYLRSKGGRDMYLGSYNVCDCILDSLSPVTGYSICIGNSTSLTAEILSANGYRTGEYTWSPAAGLTTTLGAQLSASPTVSTTYFAKGVNALGCNAIQTIKLTVNPLPEANDTSITIDFGEGITIDASGGVAYEWSPSDGLSCTNCASPVASPSATTIYTLKTVDANGCSTTSSVEVKGLPRTLDVPNIFTPNGDNHNDALSFKILGYTTVTIQIYNRWGEKVFESDNSKEMWNGNINQNGKAAPEGAYYYIVDAEADADKVQKTGYITLFR